MKCWWWFVQVYWSSFPNNLLKYHEHTSNLKRNRYQNHKISLLIRTKKAEVLEATWILKILSGKCLKWIDFMEQKCNRLSWQKRVIVESQWWLSFTFEKIITTNQKWPNLSSDHFHIGNYFYEFLGFRSGAFYYSKWILQNCWIIARAVGSNNLKCQKCHFFPLFDQINENVSGRMTFIKNWFAPLKEKLMDGKWQKVSEEVQNTETKLNVNEVV